MSGSKVIIHQPCLNVQRPAMPSTERMLKDTLTRGSLDLKMPVPEQGSPDTAMQQRSKKGELLLSRI